MRRARDAEAGAVAVEFALLATVLLVLVLAAVSFGLQFGARILATQAASEGARAAVAGLTAAERQTLAQAAATALLDGYGGIATARRVTVTPVGAPVTHVQVEVEIDLTAFGLSRLSGFLPVLPDRPSARVSVQVGGF